MLPPKNVKTKNRDAQDADRETPATRSSGLYRHISWLLHLFTSLTRAFSEHERGAGGEGEGEGEGGEGGEDGGEGGGGGAGGVFTKQASSLIQILPDLRTGCPRHKHSRRSIQPGREDVVVVVAV